MYKDILDARFALTNVNTQTISKLVHGNLVEHYGIKK